METINSELCGKRPRLHKWGLNTDSWLGSVFHPTSEHRSALSEAFDDHALAQRAHLTRQLEELARKEQAAAAAAAGASAETGAEAAVEAEAGGGNMWRDVEAEGEALAESYERFGQYEKSRQVRGWPAWKY